MNKKKEGELIKLIAIIVILLTFIVIAIGSVLQLSSSREDAFRTEANKVLKASDKAIDKIVDGKLQLTNDKDSCKIDESRYCFSVDYLLNNKLYSNDSNSYIGKVITSDKTKDKELYLKKNDEFKIIGGSSTNYKRSGTLSLFEWKENHSICECNEDN